MSQSEQNFSQSFKELEDKFYQELKVAKADRRKKNLKALRNWVFDNQKAIVGLKYMLLGQKKLI